MLRGVIICPDQELSQRLQAALEGQRVGIIRNLPRYPNIVDLMRFLRAAAPEVVFLSVESRSEALEVAARIEAQSSGTQVVAVNRTCDPQTLLDTMRSGIREFLSPPFEPRQIADVLFRLEDAVQQKPPSIQSTDLLYAFLPSKPGVGASTIAVNTALALSQIEGCNTLLADFDLNCGMIGFMLRLDSQHSVLDAAENASEMDENVWPRLVSSVGNLDVLSSGKFVPGYRIDPVQIRYLLEFARRNYRAICVDLSGIMEKFAVELLQEAKQIFLVVTPEIPSLHLARERLRFLRDVDLAGRVSLLLNRADKRHENSRAEVEKLFGMPIYMTLPNDYSGVHEALTAGKAVASSSELGKKFGELARIMAGKPSQAAPEAKRGLMDMLSARKRSILAQR